MCENYLPLLIDENGSNYPYHPWR